MKGRSVAGIERRVERDLRVEGDEAGENAANPRVGSRVQQTCSGRAEKAVEVVRAHEDGTSEAGGTCLARGHGDERVASARCTVTKARWQQRVGTPRSGRAETRSEGAARVRRPERVEQTGGGAQDRTNGATSGC